MESEEDIPERNAIVSADIGRPRLIVMVAIDMVAIDLNIHIFYELALSLQNKRFCINCSSLCVLFSLSNL